MSNNVPLITTLKLTMVSFTYRGSRWSFFLKLPLGEDGKAYLPCEMLPGLYARCKIARGDLVGFGV